MRAILRRFRSDSFRRNYPNLLSTLALGVIARSWVPFIQSEKYPQRQRRFLRSSKSFSETLFGCGVSLPRTFLTVSPASRCKPFINSALLER